MCQKEAEERRGNIAVVVAAVSMVLLAFAIVGLKVPVQILISRLFSYFPYFPIFCGFSHPGFLDPFPAQHHVCASSTENQQSNYLHRPWIHSMRRVRTKIKCFKSSAQVRSDTSLVRISNLCGEAATCLQSKKEQKTGSFSPSSV